MKKYNSILSYANNICSKHLLYHIQEEDGVTLIFLKDMYTYNTFFVTKYNVCNNENKRAFILSRVIITDYSACLVAYKIQWYGLTFCIFSN